MKHVQPRLQVPQGTHPQSANVPLLNQELRQQIRVLQQDSLRKVEDRLQKRIKHQESA